jgi:hypothetical protein
MAGGQASPRIAGMTCRQPSRNPKLFSDKRSIEPMKKMPLCLTAILSLAIGSFQAQAASVSATLSVTVQAPLAVVFTPATPTIACSTPAGTVVSALSVTGGDGNAVTWSLAGDTTDFALSGSNLVVSSGGITSADSGKTDTVTVTATQP